MIRPADAAVLIVALVALVVWGFYRARATRDLSGAVDFLLSHPAVTSSTVVRACRPITSQGHAS